ncbi:MAG: hypothetical protein AB8C46_12360 [Burkholderiaceae bacterium]
MPFKTPYVLLASMDVAPEHEAVFNEVYDQEHVPFLLTVPGVRAVTRIKGEPFSMMIGGEEKAMPAADPVYTAVYEIDHPDVLNSPAWAEAVERGRWPAEVRPHTRKRQHLIYKTTLSEQEA